MNGNIYTALLIMVMALVTWLLRALPFLVFRKHTPSYVLYLGKVLPAAVMGMLVVYCLRNVSFSTAPFGLPEVIAGLSVVIMQRFRRNSLLSILTGTILYMLIVKLWAGV